MTRHKYLAFFLCCCCCLSSLYVSNYILPSNQTEKKHEIIMKRLMRNFLQPHNYKNVYTRRQKRRKKVKQILRARTSKKMSQWIFLCNAHSLVTCSHTLCSFFYYFALSFIIFTSHCYFCLNSFNSMYNWSNRPTHHEFVWFQNSFIFMKTWYQRRIDIFEWDDLANTINWSITDTFKIFFAQKVHVRKEFENILVPKISYSKN